MRPVCSANGMNSSGGMKLPSGDSHRIKASGSHDSIAVEIRLGLVVDLQLIAVDSPAELPDQSQLLRAVSDPVHGSRTRCSSLSFALYIATSARCIRVSASWPCSGNRAMPMLAPRSIRCPFTSIGRQSSPPHPPPRRRRFLPVRHRQKDGELVAAEASSGDLGAQRAFETGSDLLQESGHRGDDRECR